MPVSLVSALVLPVVIGQKPPPFPPQGRIVVAQPGWARSLKSAQQIAADADLKMRRLQRASAGWRAFFDYPDVAGSANGGWSVFSPDVWRLETVDNSSPSARFRSRTFVSDGKQWKALGTGGVRQPLPLARWRRPAPIPLESWGSTFPVELARMVGSDRRTLSTLVRQATQSGMTVIAQTRVVGVQGRQARLNRLLLTAGKGRLRQTEIVLDDRYGTPTTVRTREVVRGKQILGFWAMRWDLNPRQTFRPTDFKLP